MILSDSLQRIIRYTIIFIILVLPSCQKAHTPLMNEGQSGNNSVITVFAAAGLTQVLGEIADSFSMHKGVQVQLNMASSGILARQIEQGNLPDIYISANTRWAMYVDSLGMVIHPYQLSIATNSLVLIAPEGSVLNKDTLETEFERFAKSSEGRLSMGDPRHVPAGIYAKEALETMGMYHNLSQKILPAKDVRSALMMVEMGEAPLGIVYYTDAFQSAKVDILGVFPDSTHTPIEMVASVCKNNKEAVSFYTYLSSPPIKKVWLKHGYNTD